MRKCVKRCKQWVDRVYAEHVELVKTDDELDYGHDHAYY